ncbi:fructokinase-1-like isoform X1 [Prosopis cineraria]|uniref:fructokinase-1-like isoform X1 n=1 Tax=Prosopis cineraria TaxID=364024 RepID=UPI00240F861D|nr:fructokinase-1-like isoform X1 [Prosopis cineraria]
MSSDSAVPLAGSPIIVGFGGAALDFLAVVAAFPKPDDKIRSTNLKVQGGGNAGNALTCAARLGLKPRIISKVANDIQGRAVLEELEADGVDTFFFVVSEEGCSPFSYVIIDSQAKTRTCIFTAGYPPMMPEDLSRDSLLSALDGARLVYFDGRMHETALLIAREAFCKNISILVDAERPREGLDELLTMTDYLVCAERFPQAWTEAASIPRAMVSILLKLPKLKFVIATLGENGSMMLEQCMDDGPQTEEMDVDRSFESLVRQKDDSIAKPTCIATHVTKFRAEGIGSVCGRLYVGTAEKIPPSELIDTNGAGDAFVGAVLYAICNNLSPEKMLPFASCVAAAKCKALGARSGLPRREDPCLASFYNRDPNQ